jgi:predicted nucleic acid-binding protein
VAAVNEDSPGLLGTSVFIHAQTHDEHAEECLRFLEAVQAGRIRTRLEPLVVHELSYDLPHYRKGMSRAQTAEYLLAVLAWDGIVGEKALQSGKGLVVSCCLMTNACTEVA